MGAPCTVTLTFLVVYFYDYIIVSISIALYSGAFMSKGILTLSTNQITIKSSVPLHRAFHSTIRLN